MEQGLKALEPEEYTKVGRWLILSLSGVFCIYVTGNLFLSAGNLDCSEFGAVEYDVGIVTSTILI